ncbi:transcriptional regulator, ArsR family [Polynucleobacter kasalickyi]|uniref:Transcriptional regulator, ArsR family n=2 Tax=Polynucleobacter kasalickyi TaxID=1938817 RepID=A0A1W2C347_9BURK|nr:transcriptional regulator, ArsR family [Polynucleobacter kasalickyi]
MVEMKGITPLETKFNEFVTYFHIIGNMNNKDAIAAFLALGNESRLNVFRLIVQRGDVGITPSELIEKLGIPNATLSYQLKELVTANLLVVERQSRHLIYRPNAALVENLTEFLLDNCCNGKPCSPNQTLMKAIST